MRYRYLVDLRRGISVFAIFSYGIAVLGTPQCPPRLAMKIFKSHHNSLKHALLLQRVTVTQNVFLSIKCTIVLLTLGAAT